MDFTRIIFVLIIFIVLYYLLSWFLESSVKLSGVKSAKTMMEIEPKKTLTKKTEFAYSIWFNIANWSGDNSKYGEEKFLFKKGASETHSVSTPLLIQTYFKKFENDLVIKIAYKDGTSIFEHHTCELSNIPLQKWVNIIISVNTKVIDVYMDGKLAKTCVMPKPPYIGNTTEKVFLTPNDGFSGETANFRFFSNPLNPQQAWNVYKAGFGSGFFSSMLNKYKLKVAFMKDNQEYNSFII